MEEATNQELHENTEAPSEEPIEAPAESGDDDEDSASEE